MKPKNNQKINLTIDRMGINGEGIGRWHGFTLFVDGALPGEVIQAKVTETKPNYGKATVLQADNYSPARVKPPCPLFGTCGGCQIMHLSYDEQLIMKQQRVMDALQRIGKFENPKVEPCVPSKSPLGYRNKIQIHSRQGKLGFYAKSSHDLIEVDHCYIHCPLGEEVYSKLRPLIKDLTLKHIIIKTAINTNEVLVVFVTQNSIDLESIAKELIKQCPAVRGVIQNINSGSSLFGDDFKTVAGEAQITEILCGLKFKISASSFFQVNPAQAEQLYQKAVEFAALTGSETILDAFCGVGTLSLICAKNAREVIGIECVPEAIRDAKENASINGIENVRFICDTAEKGISKLPKLDVVILNPPRKGCEPQLLKELNAKKIIYISCDPATLARDLAILAESGYKIQAIQPFDMFPQTAHVETVVLLDFS